MQKIINLFLLFLKQHYLALFFAFIVGLVCVLPQFLAIKAIGNDYKGIHFMFTANEDVYMARIQEVIDGHWRVGSAFFYEYKHWKTWVPPIGEYFYAIPALLFHISLPKILIVSKFFFPAILFFLVYLLILRLSIEKKLLSTKINAVAGGLFVTLGYDLIDFKTTWLFLTGQREATNLLLWTRPVNPIIGALLFFIFLLLLLKIINNGRHWWSLLAGLVWGLMIGYFFSWSLSFGVAGFLLLFFIFFKNYAVVKKVLLIFLTFFIVTLPYWWNVFSSWGSAGGEGRAAKNGMFFIHAPIINKVLILITLVFLLALLIEYFYNKELKKQNWWWFCLALLLAGWAAFNQQIITGRTIWPYHFVQYTIPISIVIGMVFAANYLKTKFFKVWLAGIVILVGLIAVFNTLAIKSYVNYYEDFRELQKYGDLFLWLNKNTPKDCVFLVQEEADRLGVLIPALTHCNVYTSSWVFDGVPPERIKHNYLVWLRLLEVDPNNIEAYLNKNQSNLRSYFFDNWDHLFSDTSDKWFTDMVKQLASDYRDFSNKDFTTELKKYRLDYIMVKNQLSKKLYEALPSLRQVYYANGYYLYKF